MAVNWHEFAAGNETGDLKGKVGYARLPRGPKRSASMYGGTGIGINGTSPEREQKAAWLFVNWATSKQTQLANLKSKVGGGTPTRDSVYKLPEIEQARKPPSKMPNILTADAVFEAWKPENIGLRPKIAAWNECDTTIFTQLSKMILGSTTAAFAAVTLMDVWEWTPLIALIVLAGLASMPGQVLEAAKVDGATYLQRLRHIVLPMIAGVIVVALLIRSMDAIRYFDIIQNTTNGGPADATKIIPIRLYETSFRFFDLGYAAAIGLSMLAASILIANLFLKVLHKRGLAK
jgi:hypothetical protein